jgi:hypothetical protein
MYILQSQAPPLMQTNPAAQTYSEPRLGMRIWCGIMTPLAIIGAIGMNSNMTVVANMADYLIIIFSVLNAYKIVISLLGFAMVCNTAFDFKYPLLYMTYAAFGVQAIFSGTALGLSIWYLGNV